MFTHDVSNNDNNNRNSDSNDDDNGNEDEDEDDDDRKYSDRPITILNSEWIIRKMERKQ